MSAWAGEDVADRFKELRDSKRLRGNEANIYYWKKQGLQALKDRLAELDSTPTRSQLDAEAKEGAVLMYSDDDWSVYLINSVKAAKKYGKSTKWCIAGKGGELGQPDAESYWAKYRNDGVVAVYFVLSKRDDRVKYCALVYGDGKRDFWAADDTNVGFIPNAPDFAPIKLLASQPVPKAVESMASVIAEGLMLKYVTGDFAGGEPTSKRATRFRHHLANKRPKFALTMLYGASVPSDAHTLALTDRLKEDFISILSSFDQFGDKASLKASFDGHEGWLEAIVAELLRDKLLAAYEKHKDEALI